MRTPAIHVDTERSTIGNNAVAKKTASTQ